MTHLEEALKKDTEKNARPGIIAESEALGAVEYFKPSKRIEAYECAYTLGK